MNASEIAEIDRRRAILCALYLAPGSRLGLRPLRGQIEQCGYVVSLDRLRTDCYWLEEQGLAVCKSDVVTITDRGADVVLGRVNVPGVKRPEPGELPV